MAFGDGRCLDDQSKFVDNYDYVHLNAYASNATGTDAGRALGIRAST